MASQSTRPVRDLSDLDNLPNILRVDEVATILGRSESAVYYLVRSHQLPAIRPFEKSRRIIGIHRDALLGLLK